MKISKSFIRKLVHASGFIDSIRLANRRGLRILMYHRFPEDTSGLMAQCEYIRRYYQPVSLRGVSHWLTKGEPLPPNSIAITIDDGYRDFLLRGYPVFHKFEIPTTVYLVSGFLDVELWLWWNQVEYAFSQTELHSFDLEPSFGGPKRFALQTAAERFSAGSTVAIALTKLENSARQQFIAELEHALKITLPQKAPPSMCPLSWDEVRELSRNGVEFGAHTRTHPILSRIRDVSELRYEIKGSQQRLEQELDEACIHFCYPNGSFEDFTDETVALVKECGFQTAVTTEHGFNFSGADPFRLRRTAVEPFGATHYFRELLAGVRKD